MSDRRRDLRTRAALDRLESYCRQHPGGLSFLAPFEGVRLTPTQHLVAACYTDGRTRAAIAEAVGCSPGTVAVHLRQIAERIGGKGPTRERITGWVRRRRLAVHGVAELVAPR